MQKTIKPEFGIADAKIRAANAFNISLFAGIVFAGIASFAFFSRSMQFDNGIYLLLFSATLSFIGTGLCARGKSDAGTLAVILGLVATFFGQVFLQKGIAIPSSIINFILVSAIALYALPSRWIGRVVGASFAVSVGAIIIDQYTFGIPTSQSYQWQMYVAAFLGVIGIAFIAGRFSNFQLRTKLIMGFLFVGTVPLLALGWQTYTTSQDILVEQIKGDLRGGANSTSRSIELYVNEQRHMLAIEASLNDIAEYLSLPKSEMNGSAEERHALNILKTFAAKDKKILSYSLLHLDGTDLLDTVRANINVTYGDQPFFTEPLRTKTSYVSSVQFPRRYKVPVVYFSVPVFNENEQIVGILAATYDASVLQEALQIAVENRSSGTEYTFLIDGIYFINLGHSSNRDLLYKSYDNMDETLLASLQTQGMIKGTGTRSDLIAPQPEIVEALRGMDIQKSFQAPSWENDGTPAELAASRVAGTTWIVVSAQPLSSIATLTQDQTRATVTTSAAIIIISAIIALLASNFFTNPILELTQVAARISAGDFTQKAKVKQADEIGVLGETLNKMTEQVQELIGTLEKRVADRTVELEEATTQSEKRARELQAIADLSRYVSNEKDVEKLLPLITREVSERFGFYHVGIFLLNDSKRFAVLRAANSEGGQAMLRRQHKLEVGQTGIVGDVTATGVPRIALDTGADAIYFNNPDLPETHSEMALPLVVRGEIIGALDVQSVVPNAFSASDLFNLGLLADQIAIAIDNARLIEETRKALAESQSVFREYLAEAWQSKKSSGIIGYYQTVAGGSFIAQDTVELAEQIAEDKEIVSIPIRLRGQVIGALNILLDKEREELSPDQINIVNAIAERLGLALENARLFEETSSRASREKLVTDITTKIRSTNNPQEMIQIAMEELKRALGASRVEVVPQKASSLQNK